MARALMLQLDGSIPNLALMRLAAHCRAAGDSVELRHAPTIAKAEKRLGDDFDRVYASLIFERTRPVAERVERVWPGAMIGGSGWDESITVAHAGASPDGPLDYSDYPNWPHSIGFTQRGCRLACSFCKVRRMEGKVRAVATINDLWRGEPWPRHVLLLDNDFFGQDGWADRIEEIKAGGFKVSFNQGFNVRLIDEEQAAAVAGVPYYDGTFKTRRLYTAWDNRRDETLLFRNLEALVRHGVRPDHLLVYMLIGYDHATRAPRPTLGPDDLHRQRRLREFGARPYPMPFVRSPELVGFQRWVVKRIDLMVPWEEFARAGYRPERFGLRDASTPLFDSATA